MTILKEIVLRSSLLNSEHGGGIQRSLRRISKRAIILRQVGLAGGRIALHNLSLLRPLSHFAEQNQHFSEVRKAVDSTHVFFNMEIAVSARMWIIHLELRILTLVEGPYWSLYLGLSLST